MRFLPFVSHCRHLGAGPSGRHLGYGMFPALILLHCVCVYVCRYVCASVPVPVCMHVQVCIRQICVMVYSMYMHACVYVCTSMCVYVSIHVYILVCTCVSVCLCVSICVYDVCVVCVCTYMSMYMRVCCVHAHVCNYVSVQFSCSVTQSYLTLCDPIDCSTPGFPVHHQLPELAQTHAHQVGDAIQQSHPLYPPSPLALNLSQHQGLLH